MTSWFDTALNSTSREDFLANVEDFKRRHTLNEVEQGILDIIVVHDDVCRRSERAIKSGMDRKEETYDIPIPIDSFATFVKLLKEKEIESFKGMEPMDIHAVGMLAGIILGYKLAESKLK